MPKSRSFRSTARSLGLADGVLGLALGFALIAGVILALRFLSQFTGV